MTGSYKLSPLIGFHGCEKDVAESVFAGETHLNSSENDYDWLGSGIYFWVDSYERAIDWASSNSDIKELKEKTHVQIAVRTPESILGYFRPQQLANF